MANNNIGWGQGATNNSIGWGRGSTNNIGWGGVYAESWSGDTDIVGGDERFIISVKTDNAGTSTSTQFTIPTTGTGYNYTIETSDGQTITGVTGNHTIEFGTAGTYDVYISGDFPRIYFSNTGDKSKIVDIKNWGSIEWTSMASAFFGCNKLTVLTATDAPDLSGVTSIFGMFYGCSLLSELDANNWDVSGVTNMSSVFVVCTNLTTLNISAWDTSAATTMTSMFFFVNKLTSLDVSEWNTDNVTNMNGMFHSCSQLKADLSGLDITSVTNFTDFAISVNLNESGTTTNYDNTLISWYNQLQSAFPDGVGYTPSISINFGNSQYSYVGEVARQRLVDVFGWSIVDGGKLEKDEFVFTVDTTIAGASGIGNFQLPLVSSGTIDVIVDWGDGTTDNITTYNQAETLHSYSTADEYQIKITSSVAGTNVIKGWQFNAGGDRFKMRNIANWGDFDISVSLGFYGCSSLTQTATDSPTISSTSLYQYFGFCTPFNGDLSGWNVSSVTNFQGMFRNMSSFNSDISGWNTSSALTMASMFENNSSFNQNLSGWDINQVTIFTNFLFGGTLSTTNYDALLVGWEAQAPTSGITINFGGSQYTAGSAAETARASLISTYGWTITDGGPA